MPLAPANIRRDNYLASDWNRIVNAYLDNMARLAKTQIAERPYFPPTTTVHTCS